jgi:hypothetical protein
VCACSALYPTQRYRQPIQANAAIDQHRDKPGFAEGLSGVGSSDGGLIETRLYENICPVELPHQQHPTVQ